MLKKCYSNEQKSDREWKEKNAEYLKQIQRFLDIADNIQDEKLKKEIIIQMLKCDEILTKLSEERFEKSKE